eukprot:Gb_34486 [translate_table: standard]
MIPNLTWEMSVYALSGQSASTWRHGLELEPLKLKLMFFPATNRQVGGRSLLGDLVIRAGIDINRRHYFDEQLRRQQEAEALEAEAEVSCPVHCVREVYNYRDFEKILNEAEQHNKLQLWREGWTMKEGWNLTQNGEGECSSKEYVVVDFYNTSCGVCKYVLPQFIKLCKRECGEECSIGDDPAVIFVKHNVRDQYDELTDLARFYSIRSVPMFSFFVDGCRVEQFPTRNRLRLENTVCYLLEQYVINKLE